LHQKMVQGLPPQAIDFAFKGPHPIF